MMERWPTIEELESFVQTPHTCPEAGASGCDGTAVHCIEVPTVAGTFGISASACGVASVFFPGADDRDVAARHSRHGLSPGAWGRRRAIEAGLELMGYVLGEVKALETPVDLSFLTPFMRDVFEALRTVPYGRTVTYGELAGLAGHPGKSRAVGTAMRHNPVPIFVPCHRVVSSGGGLGGWSGPEGWKEWLLELERRQPAPPAARIGL
jgi:methylated-DNA-[protein]-cysteine S-methyltransferase